MLKRASEGSLSIILARRDQASNVLWSKGAWGPQVYQLRRHGLSHCLTSEKALRIYFQLAMFLVPW